MGVLQAESSGIGPDAVAPRQEPGHDAGRGASGESQARLVDVQTGP